MLKLYIENQKLLLKYSSQNGAGWADNSLKTKGYVTIAKVFTFLPNNVCDQGDLDPDEPDRTFVLGCCEGEHCRISREVLGTKYDVLIAQSIALSTKSFIASRSISVFKKVETVVDEPIVVSDAIEGAISIQGFQSLLDNFPTTTEHLHYANARIEGVLRDYFDKTLNAQEKFEKYLSKRKTITPKSRVKFFNQYEAEKYRYIRDTVTEMLADSESYSEDTWQKLIVEFLLLLFPKYIAVLENLQVKDYYSKPGKTINRFIDLTLVDVNGNIDIVELKKPSTNPMLSSGKYRDNYTPAKELSGAVMQVEKYLFHLNKYGSEGEKKINAKRSAELPEGIEVRVSNPKGMIILGRDNLLTDEQSFDFEIIKRKYANIIDIMTYDDLLRRLDNTILKYENPK